ncbi:MAG: DNA-binding domain-containing protein [Pseudomonadota bacterium]
MREAVPTADGEGALASALLSPECPAPPAVADPRRFSVYRNNVVVGLIDAIAATYPAVLALVGEDFFRAAAREFVLQHPPQSPVLISYGGSLPDWISAFPPAAGVPYLGDVAALDWAWNRAYNAADAAPLEGACLAGIAPEDLIGMRVTLHPSVALISSPYPAVSIWAQATKRVPATQLDLSTPESGLVVRPHDGVDVRAISAGLFAVLSALQTGATIGGAAETLDGDQQQIAECIGGLFQLGLVTALNAPDETEPRSDDDDRSA